MTHEEKAREIISWIEQNMSWKYEREVIAYVVEQLASAEKKAYEKGREEGKRDFDIQQDLTIHDLEDKVDSIWNEAIAEAVKVAEEMGKPLATTSGDSPCYFTVEQIADKINKLKRG